MNNPRVEVLIIPKIIIINELSFSPNTLIGELPFADNTTFELSYTNAPSVPRLLAPNFEIINK